jgi:hypothetical protein
MRRLVMPWAFLGLALLAGGASAGARSAGLGAWPQTSLQAHDGSAATGSPAGGGTVRVIVDPSGGVAAAEAAVSARGGHVEAVTDGLVEAVLPAGSVDALAESPAISKIRPPATPLPQAVTNEGVTQVGADIWHAAGDTGAGVKVAIVDLGFIGYQSALAGAAITTDNRCGGATTAASVAVNTEHGSAVAELVRQMAPGAQLILICIDTELDLALAEQDAAAAGAKIINHSVGWLATSRGDGTGAAGSPDATVAAARTQGILWVNAAGNYATQHWSGSFTPDPGASDVNDFAPGDTLDSVTIPSDERDCAFLKWDAWPTTSEDYDLYLVDESSNQIVDASTEDQADGPLDPTEALCYTNSGATGTFGLGIARYSAASSPRLDLYWAGGEQDLQYSTGGAVVEPASSPAALAVGAECWQTQAIEPFSSEGATIDGRTKPELVAPDSVSTATYGSATAGAAGCGTSGFAGTSASSPQVAGAAALLLQAHPTWGVVELTGALEAREAARAGGRLALGAASAGGSIAYESGGDVYVADADGAARRLVMQFAHAPSWSPSGDRLAVDTNSGLVTVAPDGSNPTTLVPLPSYEAELPAWSPDGTKIVYAYAWFPGGGGGIWVVPAAGGTPVELNSSTYVGSPVWSPDGTKIAFLESQSSPANPPSIWIMNADGSNARELATTNQPLSWGLDERNLAWSPDGTKLLFATSDEPLRVPPIKSIAVANVDGSGDQVLVPAFADLSFSDPSWSPDGSKIIFDDTTLAGPGPIASPPGLDTANADGSGRRQLLDIADIATAGWSAAKLLANLSPPTIGGTARVGETLQATPGLWTDTAGSTFTFAWERCNSAGAACAPIGATDVVYPISAADVGSTLRVRVTATDGASSATAASAVSAVVTVAPPVPLSLPAMSGVYEPGTGLTIDSYGTWSGSPSLSYRFRSCAEDGSSCIDTPNPPNTPYSLGPADSGKSVRLVVTATNAGGQAVATSSLVPGPPADVQALAGAGFAVVSFKPSPNGVPVDTYTATASPGGMMLSGPGDPSAGPLSIRFNGLTPGVSYRFTVVATNEAGVSDASAPSNAVVPTGGGGGGGGGVTTTTSTTTSTVTAPAPAPSQTTTSPVVTAQPRPPRTATAAATLTVGAPKPVHLARKHPSLVVTVKASTATTLVLRLLDAKGKKVAEWTHRSRSGKTSVTLLLPPKARHRGRDTLRITSTGSTKATVVAVVLRA